MAGAVGAVAWSVAIESIGVIGAFERGKIDCFEETRRELRIEVVRART